jgi:hypothetical protein
MDNAAWVKDGITITANATNSPDGYANADLLTATTGQKRIYQTYTTTFGIDYTLSAFVKQGTSNSIQFVMPNVAGGPVFTFSTESFSTVSGWTASFDNYGNGWYRIKATRTSTSSNAGFQLVIPTDGQSVYVWGAQFEAGAYGTSYVKTEAAAVTRLAESISKTLVNSNSNFSFFLELDEPPLANGGGDWLAIAPSDRLGRVFMFATSFGFADLYSAAAPVANQTKFAWTQVSSTTAKVFSNGALRSSSTNGNYTNPFNLFSITAAYLDKPVRIKQLIFFDAPISDAKAIELTTP